MTLGHIQFAEFRFDLRAIAPLYLPARNKGNTLRGALGTMLRRLCCYPQCAGATSCELRATCPYAQVFEPAAPKGAPALSNYEAIPRPFVIRPPLEEKTHYEPGEALSLGLVLIGRAIEFLPHFVLTFERLAEEGLGLNRARCRLERVQQLNPRNPRMVFDGESRVMNQPDSECISGNPQSAIRNPQLTVRFLTPTHLTFDGKEVRSPEFHHLVRRLRDRLNALATFYCGGPLELDFRGLGDRAAAVRCTRRALTWEDRDRQSSRSGRRHSIGGFIGECEFSGELGEFVPLLRLGERLHVGKHTAWGNGWLELGTLQGAAAPAPLTRMNAD